MNPAIVFLGMGGPLSVRPLRWLIDHGHPPAVVAVPSHLLPLPPSVRQLPVDQPLVTCAQVAQRYDIPVLGVTHEWMARIAEQPGDLLLSACWPWRLPTSVLDAFDRAAFNLHPSALPRYRGPAPVFWQLREGAPEAGVTLHRLTSGLDEGAIVAQRTIPIDDSHTEDSLSDALGAQSGALLDVLLGAPSPAAVPSTAQNESDRSYFPAPQDGDFTVSATWEPQRAFRFIHGTAARNHPYRVQWETGHLRARDAVSYESHSAQTAPVYALPGRVRVRFGSGSVDLIPG